MGKSYGILDLYDMKAFNSGVKAVIQAIPKMPDLIRLRLGWNNIGVEGAKMLSKALPHCKKLEGLLLGTLTFGVDTRGDCIYSFANDKPCYYDSSTYTCNYKNYFYTEETRAIAEVVKKLPSLVCLDLEGCNVTHEAMEDVVKAVNSHPRISEVWLRDNPQLVGKTYPFKSLTWLHMPKAPDS
eukprot:TRINITY_DN15977_c0_g1_i1.p1 TRINITY_DN15977_c0_g1~~TRINITY_DN15977_c0_g1_i1.p1  ORF type:complete len:183 (+),score=28.27 TRINITY_DN15977_c0_g1_i1:97-645(+)